MSAREQRYLVKTAYNELDDFTTTMMGCHAFLRSIYQKQCNEEVLAEEAEAQEQEGDDEEESRSCRGPVKLACGHIIGLDCLYEVSQTLIRTKM